MSDPTQPFAPDMSPQELSPVTSPPSNPRQILSMGIKSPPFAHPVQTTPMRHPPPTPTPIDFPPINTPDVDPYAKQPSTPKPPPPPPTFQTSRLPADPYAQQPSTPRPQFPIARPTLQGMSQQVRPSEGQELNRQLRDLLQRHQFKKLDDQIMVGKGQQRIWPPPEGNQEGENTTGTSVAVAGDATFRHPLPPAIARPRVPMGPVPRQPGPLLGLRMQQLDPRIQGLDPRMRLLIQQQVRIFYFQLSFLFLFFRHSFFLSAFKASHTGGGYLLILLFNS